MNIVEIARKALILEKIVCDLVDESKACKSFASILLQFEGGISVSLTTDSDSDELVLSKKTHYSAKVIQLHTLWPSLQHIQGLRLTSCWEMKNHQGYFDALQLEFSDDSLSKTFILQFKVIASSIWVFEVRSAGDTCQ